MEDLKRRWWNLDSQGLAPFPKRIANIMASWHWASDIGTLAYSGAAINVDKNNYGIIWEHHGHDYDSNGCYDTFSNGGHDHVYYGFGENNKLLGFMVMEDSFSYETDGAYFSITTELKA